MYVIARGLPRSPRRELDELGTHRVIWTMPAELADATQSGCGRDHAERFCGRSFGAARTT